MRRLFGRALVIAGFVLGSCCGAAVGQEGGDAAEDLYFSANALYNRKLYSVAIKEYRTFLQKHPNHAKASQARLGLALGLYATAEYAEAEPVFKDLLARGKAGDAEQVPMPAFVEGFREESNVATAYLRMGMAYAAKGDRENAVKTLAHLVGTYPQFAHFHVALAELGRRPRSIRYCGSSRRASGWRAAGWVWVGRLRTASSTTSRLPAGPHPSLERAVLHRRHVGPSART